MKHAYFFLLVAFRSFVSLVYVLGPRYYAYILILSLQMGEMRCPFSFVYSDSLNSIKPSYKMILVFLLTKIELHLEPKTVSSSAFLQRTNTISSNLFDTCKKRKPPCPGHHLLYCTFSFNLYPYVNNWLTQHFLL